MFFSKFPTVDGTLPLLPLIYEFCTVPCAPPCSRYVWKGLHGAGSSYCDHRPVCEFSLWSPFLPKVTCGGPRPTVLNWPADRSPSPCVDFPCARVYGFSEITRFGAVVPRLSSMAVQNAMILGEAFELLNRCQLRRDQTCLNSSPQNRKPGSPYSSHRLSSRVKVTYRSLRCSSQDCHSAKTCVGRVSLTWRLCEAALRQPSERRVRLVRRSEQQQAATERASGSQDAVHLHTIAG